MAAPSPAGTFTPASFADTQQTGCGTLLVALMRAMRPLGPREVLHVRAADPGAVHDVPSWCRMTATGCSPSPPGSGPPTTRSRRSRSDGKLLVSTTNAPSGPDAAMAAVAEAARVLRAEPAAARAA